MCLCFWAQNKYWLYKNSVAMLCNTLLKLVCKNDDKLHLQIPLHQFST